MDRCVWVGGGIYVDRISDAYICPAAVLASRLCSDLSPRRWYRAQRRATSMYVCMCGDAYSKDLFLFRYHLDVAGTTPAEIVCMYVRLNTTKGDVP